MNFQELVELTKTVHLFQEEEVVDPSVVLESLNLALLSPNHRLTQPWRIFWPQTMLDRSNFLKWLEPNLGESFPILFERWMKAPQFLLFCANNSEDAIVARENYATVCCSIQLFALNLRQAGIGYKWATPKKFYGIDMSQYFKATESWQFVGLILVGFSNDDEQLKKERPKRHSIEHFLCR